MNFYNDRMHERYFTEGTPRQGRLNALFLIHCLLLLSVFAAPSLSFAGPGRWEAQVTRVNDGDTVTIKMDGKTYRTRLIGMDAPEMGQQPWGRKAKEHLQKIMNESSGKVQAEMDVTKYDKYNRLLAYLWTNDGRMINEQMVLDGYAVLFTIQPNSRYVDRFKKAQHSARNDRRGIWGPDGLKEKPIAYKKKHPRK